MIRAGHGGRQHARNRPLSATLVVLSAGPKSPSEIEDAFRAYGRRLPGDPRPHLASRGAGTKLGRSLAEAMAQAVEAGWAARHEDGSRFVLTGVGRAQAGRVLEDLRSRRARVHRLLEPSAAATTRWPAIDLPAAPGTPASLLTS